MANIITIELCAEDRARLDKLIDAFKNATPHNCETCARELSQSIRMIYTHFAGKNTAEPTGEVPTEEPVKEEPTTEAEPTEVEPTEAVPVKEDPVKEEAPTVTKAMVQQKVVSLAAIPAKKAAVREIVNSYAAKVSDIPDDKLAEAYKRLTALED